MMISTRNKLLLVDDDTHGREMLAACLSRQGFETKEASDAAEMRRLIKDESIDLILLDINLPDIDGLTLVREIRLQSQIGIILLTARDGEMERVAGLEWGADDYVTKQTPLAELIARIRALLRRTERSVAHRAPQETSPPPEESGATEFGSWRLENGAGKLTTPTGAVVTLTKSECDLLGALVRRIGETVTRAELMALMSNREWSGAERSVDVMIGRLRRKLGDDSRYPKHLQTIRGVGYRFIA